jgi:hypothetical protein
MREMSIIMYNSMLCVKFWGAGVAYIKELAASVADDTTDNKRTEKQWTKCQRFVKLKELQAATRANTFAAHLILPNRTQSPPTTRLTNG